MEIEGDGEKMTVPAGASLPDGSDEATLPDINFDDGKLSKHLQHVSFVDIVQRIKQISIVMLGLMLKKPLPLLECEH